ncbi:cytidylate kinase [Candidatus Micrarchaeota archaeon CG10_big_fil_rev_8_21_14_0_10_60_32]|nr:MAG: cytidylate kinase [Candidatus Micrarchaeota archaeon CG10_big_fil_rev_8_21_14_0_10_60_32]PIO01856.1 MAG: cytidylate kinase [Candidatus Micrarchaeota archaeon CG09_land_8_20_14_0_10_60_16]
MRVAISGLSGCGNSTVTSLVAEKLGLSRVNYTFRDMAREHGVSFEELREKAEAEFPEVDLDLDAHLVELAADGKNCVIGSRLAVWLDTPAVLKRIDFPRDQWFSFDFKFWLDASLETRARRIAKRESRPFEEVLAETRGRDGLDAARYKRLYGINVRQPQANLKVDTEKFDAEGVAQEIVRFVECQGTRR